MDQTTLADTRSWPREGFGIPGKEARDPPGVGLTLPQISSIG